MSKSNESRTNRSFISARISSYGAQNKFQNTSLGGNSSINTSRANSTVTFTAAGGSIVRRDYSPAGQVSYEQALQDRAQLIEALETT